MKKRHVFISIILTCLMAACSPFTASIEPQESEPDEIPPEQSAPFTPGPTASSPVFCLDPSAPSITDLQVYQVPEMPEPPARQEYIDPIFKTCMVRVTDSSTDLSSDDSSIGMKNEYSRVQSFNADESQFLIRGIDGTWYIYDANSLLPLRQISIGVDPRWDSEDADKLYYSDGTALFSYHVASGEASTLHDFANEFPGQTLAAVWMRYEGSPSMDTRYYGLMAENQDWLTTGFIVYDVKNDKVTAKLKLPAPYEIDSVTISPSGKYFLAYFDNYCEEGQKGSESNPCGLMIYDQDLQNGRGLLRLCGHSDPAFDTQGNEVLVYQDIDHDTISYVDLASGEITNLFDIDFSHTAIGFHFSGLAFQHPGWVVISTYGNDNTTYTWMDNEVFVLELKPNGRVARLAHTHSLVDSNQEHDYWAEPHASTNRDLTRILFTTNWHKSGTSEVETFLIQLPPNWTDNLP